MPPADLEQRYTELAALAGGLAHEIRNPLSTLNLNLQLLAEDFAQAEEPRERRAHQKIARLHKVVQQLERLLNDFLRFARVGRLEGVPSDLSALARDLIEFFAPQAEATGVVVRDETRDGLPAVRADRDLLKQALLNLLLNAHAAMPKGGELIVRTRADGGDVCLDVIDTGVGMSAETQGKIFTPFFSTRPGGSGLGLPTAQRIVEAHGGTLAAASAVGTGTAFTIRLPAANEPERPAGAP